MVKKSLKPTKNRPQKTKMRKSHSMTGKQLKSLN